MSERRAAVERDGPSPFFLGFSGSAASDLEVAVADADADADDSDADAAADDDGDGDGRCRQAEEPLGIAAMRSSTARKEEIRG